VFNTSCSTHKTPKSVAACIISLQHLYYCSIWANMSRNIKPGGTYSNHLAFKG
jgi:hypothetical protein